MILFDIILIFWAVMATVLAVWYRSESEHYQQTTDYWHGRYETAERQIERLRNQRNRALQLLKEVRDADHRA